MTVILLSFMFFRTWWRRRFRLLVVTAAGAQHVGQAAAVRSGAVAVGVTISTPFSAKNVGSGRMATPDVTGPTTKRTLVANDLVGGRNALLGVAGIVGKLEHHLLPEYAAVLVDRVDGGLSALLHLVAIGCDRAGKRRDEAEHDIGLRRRCRDDQGSRERDAGKQFFLVRPFSSSETQGSG